MHAHLLEQAPAQHRHTPAAARRAARVGALPGFERKTARRTIRADACELALERLHRRDDPLLERLEPVARQRRNAGLRSRLLNRSWRSLAAHPGDQALDMLDRRFGHDAMAEIEDMGAALRSRSARARSPRRGAVRRRPARGDRDCPEASSRSGRAAIGGLRARRRCRGRSRRCRRSAPNLAICVPAPRGKAISRAFGVSARTLAAIAAIGATHQRSNSAGGSTPAQESKICAASAPAANWRRRYSAEASTSRSIRRANRSGWR